jgi:hypothetical protein
MFYWSERHFQKGSLDPYAIDGLYSVYEGRLEPQTRDIQASIVTRPMKDSQNFLEPYETLFTSLC